MAPPYEKIVRRPGRDKAYFIQVGDSAATIARKKQARQQILESIKQQGTGRDTGAASSKPRTVRRGVAGNIPYAVEEP